jgi:hypothetical protein
VGESCFLFALPFRAFVRSGVSHRGSTQVPPLGGGLH